MTNLLTASKISIAIAKYSLNPFFRNNIKMGSGLGFGKIFQARHIDDIGYGPVTAFTSNGLSSNTAYLICLP